METHSANRIDIRPSPDDRCPECGDAVGDEWESFKQDPSDPQKLIRHFGGFVTAGPIEPMPIRPKPAPRDFRYPEDLGVFFHSWCAPRAELPKNVQEEIAELLADAIVADLEETTVRWTKVWQSLSGDSELPRCRAEVASVEGRRVFTMARSEWERFKSYEGKIIEIDLERTPTGDIAEAAAVIAGLAADCPIQAERIEIWPYKEKDEPKPWNIQDYLVLDNFARQLNLPMFAERAGTQDSPKLRKRLREHVFIVKQRPDKGRWHPKPRSLERVVFLRV